jgi:predicted transcriptional regulator
MLNHKTEVINYSELSQCNYQIMEIVWKYRSKKLQEIYYDLWEEDILRKYWNVSTDASILFRNILI